MGTEIVRYVICKDNTGCPSVLNKVEANDGQHHNHSNGLITTGHMHVAITTEKTTGIVGRTQ